MESKPKNALTPEELLKAARFDAQGLIPVVVQDVASRDVLMHAWMSREALAETLETGRMCYWSRSRGELWRKGDTSGHVQHWEALYLDCDGDTLLAVVKQTGVACHTGEWSCFFKPLQG